MQERRVESIAPIHAHNESTGPIGIIAGWGNFPLEAAKYARSLGREVVVAAVKDHADPKLAESARELRWFGVAKLGAQLRFFEKHGVRDIVLAGKLFKDRILFQRFGWVRHFPDWTCLSALWDSFILSRRDRRDDTILGSVVNLVEQRGFHVLEIGQAAPQLLVEEGSLTRHEPTVRELQDIDFALPIAAEMGRLDIGQSVTVRDRTILGVEAIEGTDSLIERTGQICPRGGFGLIKVAKPQQDMRFDVPTIGLRTIENLHRAGGRFIAIEAGRTILIDREATLTRADELGISIVAKQLAAPSKLESKATQPHQTVRLVDRLSA